MDMLRGRIRQKINCFPETEQEEKLTEAQDERWKFRKAKQGIFKPALCAEELMHWLHWDYNTSVKLSLLKITFFLVSTKKHGQMDKPQVCKSGGLGTFPSSIREGHHVCSWVSIGRPRLLRDGKKGLHKCRAHQCDLQRPLNIRLVWCASKISCSKEKTDLQRGRISQWPK